MKADRLIQVCQENTAVLTSTLRWFEDELRQVEAHVSREMEIPEIYRLQGEARAIRKLRDSLAKEARVKGEVVDDKSRIRAVR